MSAESGLRSIRALTSLRIALRSPTRHASASLQSPRSCQAWYEATPADFVFGVKGPRYITHMLRLKQVGKPLANFFASGIFKLREKLGPILWQLPPRSGEASPAAARCILFFR